MTTHYPRTPEFPIALPSPVRQIGGGVLAGLVVGGLAVYSPQYAVAVAVVGLAVATILRTWERVIYAALFVCVATPLGWNIAQVAHLNVHVAGISAVIPVLFPVVVMALTLVTAQWASGWLALWRLYPLYGLVWIGLLGALFVAFADGAGANGFMAAAKDGQYLVLYGWPLAVLGLQRFASDHFAKRAVVLVLAGTAAFSIAVCVIFALPSVRARVYEGSMWASSIRVAFGNDSLLTLGIPVLVTLLGRHVIPQRWRRVSWLGLFVMVVAVGLSQTRSDIVVIGATLLLMFAYPLVRKAPWSAGAIVKGLVVLVLVLGVAVGALYLFGSDRARRAVAEIPSRVVSLANPTRDVSWQTRAQTNKVAWSLWGQNDHARVVGLGLGTSLGLYNPAGAEVQTGAYVDNVWATAAVKGGLILVIALAGFLVTCWAAFIRAAWRAKDEVEKVVWLACALAFPGFLFESTYMSAHLLVTPSVIIAVTTLATVAALAEPQAGDHAHD